MHYRPEAWAVPRNCFENSTEKVRRDGGAVRYGWTFHYRISPGIGEYLFVTHHAVWHSPDGSLHDVTPFPEGEKHCPITQDDSVLFLVDDTAKPVTTEFLIAPLPLRFFPVSGDPPLVEYVEFLQQKETLKCEAIYKATPHSSDRSR